MADASSDADFDVLVGDHFACLKAPPGTQCHSCLGIAKGDIFDDILDRFAAQYPDADRRAAVSMWTMLHRRTMKLTLDATSVYLDPATGLPLGFAVPDFDARDATGTIFEAMDGAVHGHAAPLIEVMAARGLSAKLLWSNLAVYVDWVVREIGARIDPELCDAGLVLIDSETWPGRGRNPLFNLMRRHCEEGGAEITRRRVCCLRYLLPGIPGCGMICLLPQGRD